MSQENVGDAVRRLWAAFTKRDWDAFSATFDREVEYKPVEEHVVYRGPEAITVYAQRWLEVWERFTAEVEQIERTPEEDRVFAAMRLRGTGKGSGVETVEPLYWVADLRGGRLYRISEYNNRDEALAAAGLSE